MPYSGAPASNNNDALKLLVGDLSTSLTSELLTTSECAYLISTFGSVAAAGPHAARAIAAQFAAKVNKAVGDLKIDLSDKYRHYISLAGELERQTAIRGAAPYVGGISRSDKDASRTDSDLVQPSFRVGIHDSLLNPQTDSQTVST